MLRHHAANQLGESGNPEAATREYEQLLADLRNVHDVPPEFVLKVRYNCISWRGELGDTARAIAEFEAILEDQMAILGPSNRDLLLTRQNLAFLTGQTNPRMAVGAFAGLIETQSALLGDEHPDVLLSRHNMGHYQIESGALESGLLTLQEVAVDSSRIIGAHHPRTLLTLLVIARAQVAMGQTREGLTGLRRLDETAQQLNFADPIAVSIRSELVAMLSARGDFSASSDILRSVSEFDPDDRMGLLEKYLPSRLDMITKLFEANQFAEAASEQERLVSVLRSSNRFGPDHPLLRVTMDSIPNTFKRAGDQQNALRTLQSLLVEKERVMGPFSGDALNVRIHIAQVLAELQNFEKATQELSDVIIAMQLHRPEDVAGRERVQNILGRISDSRKRFS